MMTDYWNVRVISSKQTDENDIHSEAVARQLYTGSVAYYNSSFTIQLVRNGTDIVESSRGQGHGK